LRLVGEGNPERRPQIADLVALIFGAESAGLSPDRGVHRPVWRNAQPQWKPAFKERAGHTVRFDHDHLPIQGIGPSQIRKRLEVHRQIPLAQPESHVDPARGIGRHRDEVFLVSLVHQGRKRRHVATRIDLEQDILIVNAIIDYDVAVRQHRDTGEAVPAGFQAGI